MGAGGWKWCEDAAHVPRGNYWAAIMMVELEATLSVHDEVRIELYASFYGIFPD